LPGFSGLTFSGTRRPGFSGRICCFWPGFSGCSFSGIGNLKKLYGQQGNCSGIYSGISVLNAGIFWREAKTKRLFSQCMLHTVKHKISVYLFKKNYNFLNKIGEGPEKVKNLPRLLFRAISSSSISVHISQTF
jgi:hypothetical protein